jgi:hypothetical protein
MKSANYILLFMFLIFSCKQEDKPTIDKLKLDATTLINKKPKYSNSQRDSVKNQMDLCYGQGVFIYEYQGKVYDSYASLYETTKEATHNFIIDKAKNVLLNATHADIFLLEYPIEFSTKKEEIYAVFYQWLEHKKGLCMCHPIRSEVKRLNSKQLSILKEVLLQNGLSSGHHTCPPTYNIGFRLYQQKDTLEIGICLLCEDLEANFKNAYTHKVSVRGTNQKLYNIAHPLFPNDTVIKFYEKKYLYEKK